MNGWFCSSALGPGPSAGTGVSATNGLPGQIMTAKKKALTDASVAPAHGTSATCRPRYRYRTRLAQPVERSAQNRIDPSSAAHRLMTLKKGGVVVALLRAT